METNRKRGILTAFVLEPNSTERPVHADLKRNHRIMEDTAEELDVPLIDVSDHLHEKRESGFLWWDYVHLTSYGPETARFAGREGA